MQSVVSTFGIVGCVRKEYVTCESLSDEQTYEIKRHQLSFISCCLKA